MRHIRLSNGFETELDENVMNNMELVDVLAEAYEEENPLAVSRICKLLLGAENRKKLYDVIRKEDGRVPIEDVSASIQEIFQHLGEQGKK